MSNGPQMMRDWCATQGSVTSAAAALGLSRFTIHSWLAGRAAPDAPNRLRLRDIAGIPVDAEWGAGGVTGDGNQAAAFG